MTATPFDKLPKSAINVLPMDQTRSDTYCGWNGSDLNLQIYDCDTMEPDKFADHILSHNGDLIQAGKKFFVPAKSTKESHRLMKEVLCTKYGFHTIMINGDGIHVYAPDGRMYDQYNKIKISHSENKVRKFDKNVDELLPILKRIYSEMNLSRFPVAITGYLCIGRGITIISEDFQIDVGILSYAPDRPSASQLAGRMKKNGKHWKNLVKPDVFTTTCFNKCATDMETLSSTLAILANEKQKHQCTTILDKDDISDIYTTPLPKPKFGKLPSSNKPSVLKDEEYNACKCNVQIIPIDKDLKTFFNVNTTEELYKMKTDILYEQLSKFSEFPEKYKNYKVHKWCIDTTEKFTKYSIEKRYKQGKSFYEPILSQTKMDTDMMQSTDYDNRNKNHENYVMMYFIHKDKLNKTGVDEIMLSPWNGEAYKHT